MTAVALVTPSETLTRLVTAQVHMLAFSDAEIRTYVDTGEPMDKAGAYAVQGLGADLVERVDGCYLTVVGLPLCETVKLLVRAGVVPARRRRWCSNCEPKLG